MKEGILTFIKKVKTIYTILNVIFFFLIGLSFIILTKFYMYMGMRILFIAIMAVALVIIIALHVVYNNKVAMGTVFEYEVHGNTITLRTPKKDFTYDLLNGCKSVSDKGNRYVCLFIDADYADTFTFYKVAPFTNNPATQFSEEDILTFYPSYTTEKLR